MAAKDQKIMPDPDERPKQMLDFLPELQGHGTSLFDGYEAQAYSCYASICQPQPGDDPHDGRKILRTIPADQLWPDDNEPLIAPLGEAAHDQLRAYILGEYYPCLGARAAFMQGTYRFGYYKHLAHLSSVASMGRDLRRFTTEYEKIGDFSTFIAVFKHPQMISEEQFETHLWHHLQLLHDNDVDDWDSHYSPDPHGDNFGFSFNGKAFFVVGMNPDASRFSRRFGFTALAFNPESQIRKLKEQGIMDRFVTNVRQRDTLFQGSSNPSLPGSTNTSGGEARVYSGKKHLPNDGWKCPFKPRQAVLDLHKKRQEAAKT